MLKKTLRLIRNLIIGTIWTYLFMVLANLALFYLWNFNLFSAHSWKTIGYFWGGRRRYQKGQRLPFFVYAAVRSLVLDLGLASAHQSKLPEHFVVSRKRIQSLYHQ